MTPEEFDHKLNAVYTERMIAVRMLAVMSGCKYGIGIDRSREKCDPWRFVVYIDLPLGQVSWHIAPHDRHLFDDFPLYEGRWDGTFNGRSIEFAKMVKREPSYVMHFWLLLWMIGVAAIVPVVMTLLVTNRGMLP